MIANSPVPATAHRGIDEKLEKYMPCETKAAKKTTLAKERSYAIWLQTANVGDVILFCLLAKKKFQPFISCQ